MDELAGLLAYLLSAMGLTVLIVWPQTGSAVAARNASSALPARAQEVLDCYICCGFWTGLVLSPVWWPRTSALVLRRVPDGADPSFGSSCDQKE